MQIEQLRVSIRPRNHWQAIDLGFQLGRFWFWRLWLLWLLTALPAFTLLSAFFHANSSVLIFLIWWLKPLFELPLLYFLSRAIFSEEPQLGTILRNYWRISRSFILPLLTWRRLSLSRSFANPVQMLEGLRGKARRDRLNVLKEDVRDTCHWLIAICYHFEMLLYLAVIATLVFLVPVESETFNLWWTVMESESGAVGFFHALSYLLCMAVIAPFYTAAGFMLYLSRRTRLEGWDIELSFKRLAERLQDTRVTQGIAATLVLTALMGGYPATSAAQTPREARAVLEEVLADKAFGEMHTRTEWRVKEPVEEPDEGWQLPQWLQDGLEWLARVFAGTANFLSGITTLMEVLLWTAIITVILILVHRFGPWIKWQSLLESSRGRDRQPPDTLFGMNVTEDLLARDLAREVEEMLDRGETRSALSLLYRASLATLIHRHRLDIRESFTEGECVSAVKQVRPGDEVAFFRELTTCWCLLAYAHETPGMDSLQSLCARWSHYYAVPPA